MCTTITISGISANPMEATGHSLCLSLLFARKQMFKCTVIITISGISANSAEATGHFLSLCFFACKQMFKRTV